MAQEWAKHFYSNHAWLKNRKGYLDSLVDTDGHIVHVDGDRFYWVDEYGYEVNVSPDHVVPVRMCERCFAQGILRPAKVVHHKIWLNQENINDPHVTLAYDNFQRLCQDCHAAVHAKEDRPRVQFDEYGNVVWKDER